MKTPTFDRDGYPTMRTLTIDWSFDDEDLESLFWPFEIMAAVEAYFDESGTHRESPYVVFGGALGNLSAWKSLDASWRAVLQKYKVRAFHAADLNALRQEFDRKAGWTPEKRDRFTDLLLSVIESERIVPIAIAVDVNHFKEAASHYPKNRMRPYDFGLMLAIAQIHKFLKGKKNKSLVAVTLESGQQLREPFVRCLKDPQAVAHYEREHLHTGRVGFGDKYEVRPLQIADLIASELWKFLKKYGNADVDEDDMRYPLKRLSKRFPNWIHAVSTSEAIRDWFDYIFEWYLGPNPRIKTDGIRPLQQ